MSGKISIIMRKVLGVSFLLLITHNSLLITAFAAFKDSGWGARPAAMGGAFTAVSNDSDGILWNPAGTARMEHCGLNVMRAILFSGLQEVSLGLNSASFAYPLKGIGTVGAAWTNFIAEDLYREDCYLVSYSRRLLPWNVTEGRTFVSAGVNIKYLRNGFTLDKRTVNDPVFRSGSSRDAYSGDMGILAQRGPLSAGVVVKNFNQPDLGYLEEDKVPAETRTGVAYNSNMAFFENAVVSLEYVKRGNDANLHIGWENAFFNKRARVRAGWNNREIAAGLGYVVSLPGSLDIGLDYAHIIPLQLAERNAVTYRFSLAVEFGGAGNNNEQ